MPVHENLIPAVLAVAVAEAEAKVREVGGPNRGPRVREYLASVRMTEGHAWCAAFVYWCFATAALKLGVVNPAVRTPGALAAFRKAPPECRLPIPRSGAGQPRALAQLAPGQVFAINHGGGKGHCGLIVEVRHDREGALTVEGNTNAAGSRNGDGVYLRSRDPRTFIGVVDYRRVT